MLNDVDKEKISKVLDELRSGRPIILSDDVDRENEGDLVYAADQITPESLAFMMEHGKGLICLSITEKKRQELNLPFQVEQNESIFGTNFAVPFDHKLVHHKGITASSRAFTIRESVKDEINPDDFVVPGFVVPVVARPGGILERRGQTEGSVDLAKLAGLSPAGVICEVMDRSGKMLNGQGLAEFCNKHNIISCSVEDIAKYRLSKETSIRLVDRKEFPLKFLFRPSSVLKELPDIDNTKVRLDVFFDDVEKIEHFSLSFGETNDSVVPVRIHSECLTGDVFGSLRCDCGHQLDTALAFMIKNKKGVLIYLQQEGRGIGLANKLKAYELQEKGMDTVEANIHLGLPADGRDYRVAAQIIKLMKINEISLLTNNPEKISAMKMLGISIKERIPLEIEPGKDNIEYLKAKRLKMGHLLSFKTEK